MHHGHTEGSFPELSAPYTVGAQSVQLCPSRQVSGCIPPSPAPAPGCTHRKLGSWAEVTSEPLSDVPMVRSYPSWKGASANTAPGERPVHWGSCFNATATWLHVYIYEGRVEKGI